MAGHGPTGLNEGTSFVASTLSSFVGKALIYFSDLLGSVTANVMGGGDFQTTIQFERNILARYDLSFLSDGKEIVTRKPLVSTDPFFYTLSHLPEPFPECSRLLWSLK